jgi:CheY-like chemotaxis protein
MGQVIDNLVLNAQQAMPLGGTVTIEVTNADIGEGADPQLPAGPYVTTRITDTGTGIPPTMLDRIFDPFFTTKNKGSGLGLATCYSIVQKHDGTIRVASTVNKGTTFTVWLPASASTVQDTVSTHANAHTGTGVFLVMDDEEFVRDVADTMLTSMGYEVETFDKGEDVLDYMQKRRENKTPVTGILLDLTVPGAMGGKETITLLRKEGYDLPVFASSGYSEDPVIAHPRDYGFTDSIRKPYRKRELAALLQRHL